MTVLSRLGRRRFIAAVSAAAVLSFSAARAEVPLPDDYRTEHYRAPTPATLPGAAVVDAEETARLAGEGRAWLLFVESLERSTVPPRPWLLLQPRDVIPGSVWLPNVGKGAVTAEETAFFRAALDRLKAEKPDAGFLFYCYIDCWVSWNAARRALLLGYGPIYWYPEGVDGWMLEGRATERGRPVAPP